MRLCRFPRHRNWNLTPARHLVATTTSLSWDTSIGALLHLLEEAMEGVLVGSQGLQLGVGAVAARGDEAQATLKVGQPRGMLTAGQAYRIVVATTMQPTRLQDWSNSS